MQSDPTADTAYKAVPFRHGLQQVHHSAVHDAEIAGIQRDLHVRHLAQHAVKGGIRHAFRPALLAPFADGVDYVVAGAPLRDELWQHLGRVLQIGIHDDDGVTPGEIQAGADGNLVSEVPCQLHNSHVWVHLGQFPQHGCTAVTTPIIYEDNLVRQAFAIQNCLQALVQHGQILFLVEYRQHDRDFRPGLRGSHIAVLPARDSKSSFMYPPVQRSG